jgi:pyruvate,water dikinase
MNLDTNAQRRPTMEPLTPVPHPIDQLPPHAMTTLRGQPCSAATVRGPARIVRSLADAAGVQAGDILVTAAPLVAWAPLFARVAGLVTDTGGILSNGAILAREHGIAAVTGTRVATMVLRDGQVLEVQGEHGLVHGLTAGGTGPLQLGR